MAEEEYLKSYSDISVHRLMLNDEPRTLAYRNSIMDNKERFRDKIVLDVGCGTGILSVFCAQAGAKRVHAVECSTIAQVAKNIVKENELDKTVIVHECTVEELELNEKVDIIVSEWMGFYLLHEGMVNSVIYARDKFLKSEGLIFPESADIWVAPCELPEYFEKWENIYGVNMKFLAEVERKSKNEPAVTTVSPSHLLSEPTVLFSFSLASVTSASLQHISSKVIVPALRRGRYQGICLWFVVNFPSDDDKWHRLSTAPEEPTTHWQQTAVIFPNEILVEEAQPIAFEITLKAQENDLRKYRMEFTMLDPEVMEHPVPCNCEMTKCIVIKEYLKQSEGTEDILEEDVEEDNIST